MARHVFSLEELANPFYLVLSRTAYDEYQHEIAYCGEPGALALILNMAAQTADTSDFKPGDNAFKYVLDYLDGMRPFGTRCTLIERLKAEWYTRARS
jgi:hypothetical protein